MTLRDLKYRITPVNAGQALLELGAKKLVVKTSESAQFSTMVPHRISAIPGSGELEILSIFNRDGERAHLHDA